MQNLWFIGFKSKYICISCGCRPLTGKEYCQSCGVTTRLNQEMCVECKSMLKSSTQTPNTPQSISSTTQTNNSYYSKKDNTPNFSHLSYYFSKEFKHIYTSGEMYRGEFNFWAMLFSPLWLLLKGCWKTAVFMYTYIKCCYFFRTYRSNNCRYLLYDVIRYAW